MATTRKKSTDWWDIFLYGGIFIVVLMIINQLYSLWNSNGKSGSLTDYIGQAISNVASQIESTFQGLVLNPLSFLTSIFSDFPSFVFTLLANAFSIFISIIPGLIGGAHRLGALAPAHQCGPRLIL